MKHFARIEWKPAALAALLAAGGSAACSEGNDGPETPPGGKATPYVTQVFDYRPAVGQFVNELPEYEEGDTQETMNRKALEAIGNNNQGMVSLGGFGGYIVVGFDHTIENKAGLCDFRVQGNAFYANGQSEYGSSEPGVIEVSFDANGNGLPDDEWYEIAGSSYSEGSESWIEQAREAGNDVQTIHDYEITYYRPTTEPGKPTEEYIRWEDNQGESGYRSMNPTHLQSYYPQWIKEDRISSVAHGCPRTGSI